MAKKTSPNAIKSLTEDWANDLASGLPFSGQAVQTFIKAQFNAKVGHWCWSTSVDDNNYYHLWGFADLTAKENYLLDPAAHADLLLVDAALPISNPKTLLAEIAAKLTNEGFYVTDADGYIAVKYDNDGFDAVKLSEHLQTLIKDIDGLGLAIGETDGTAFEGSKGAALQGDVTTLKNKVAKLGNIASVTNEGYFVIDEDGNVGLMYNAKGLDAAKLSTHFVQLLKDAGLGGGSVSGVSQIAEQEFAVTDENGWVGMSYTSKGLDAAKLSTHFKTLVNAYQTEDGEALEFSNELRSYYDLGASNQNNYNNDNTIEPYAFIVAGQSNADGRIPNADFPASCEVDGTTVALSKTIEHCQFMQGSTDGTYDEPTKAFASRNNTESWAFDDVLYNLINNHLGSATDFFVCKQTRGATSLRYQYSTSFCPDLDKFNANPTWVSQLYHLYLQVKRARELQPRIRFKAMFWHQGEADNSNAEDGIYYNDFIHLIEWCRGLCNAPDMPFVFGSVPSNSSEYGEHVYNDMVKATQTMKNVYMVKMPDCTDWVQDGMDVHFGASDATYLATEMYKILTENNFI